MSSKQLKITLDKRQAKFIISLYSKGNTSLRELATVCANKWPELNLCVGNQAEGIDLIYWAKMKLKEKR